MAFEDLLKNNESKASPKSNTGLVNFFSNLAAIHHDHVLKREELLQSMMISQGECDYLTLQIRAGKMDLLSSLLNKKSELLEKNIIFAGLTSMANTGDLTAINRHSDKLTRYRMELEAIKQAKKNQGQYIQELLNQINLGVDFEGSIVDNSENYVTAISEKLKFGGIMDHSKVSRLCGFAASAAKNGDLLLAIKSYSIAGMILSVKDDLKKIIKKAKKQKNPQSQEAEELLKNLLPKAKKK